MGFWVTRPVGYMEGGEPPLLRLWLQRRNVTQSLTPLAFLYDARLLSHEPCTSCRWTVTVQSVQDSGRNVPLGAVKIYLIKERLGEMNDRDLGRRLS